MEQLWSGTRQEPYRILVLAAHTDDEIACAGLLSRCERGNNSEIRYVAFSACEESVPKHLPEDTLEKECWDSLEVLGISDFVVEGYQVRRFVDDQADIQETVYTYKMWAPDLVLCPSSTDIHQDHGVLSKAAVRVFKDTALLGYEMPWNNLTTTGTCFVRIAPEDLERKIQAAACYASQEGKSYFRPEYIRALATVRGQQASVPLAELYELLRYCG